MRRQKKQYIYETLRNRIVSGEYAPGSKLTTELELAASFSVARETLRAALKQLETDGFLERIPSKGTFIKSISRRKTILLLTMSGPDYIAQADCKNYILPGILAKAEPLGYSVEQFPRDLLTTHLPINPRELAAVVIFEGCYTGREPYLPVLRSLGVPVLMVSCTPQDQKVTGFAALYPDRIGAMQMLVGYLVRAGHRRIVFLFHEELQGFGRDFAAFRKMLGDLGADPDSLLLHCSNTMEDNRKLLAQIMALPQAERPTAIACYSDYYALLLYLAARELGVRIPEDLSVMGFSGVSDASLFTPGLSTVDLNFRSIGEVLVDMVQCADEWFGPDAVRPLPDISFAPRIISRESVAVILSKTI